MKCMEVLTAALSIVQLLYVDWKMVHWRYNMAIQNGVDKVERYQGRTFFFEYCDTTGVRYM